MNRVQMTLTAIHKTTLEIVMSYTIGKPMDGKDLDALFGVTNVLEDQIKNLHETWEEYA